MKILFFNEEEDFHTNLIYANLTTFNAQIILVNRNCCFSKELKVQIVLKLAKNTTKNEIADRYFVTDVTILHILHTCLKTYHPRFDTLSSVHCFDGFKSIKVCSGKKSHLFLHNSSIHINKNPNFLMHV